MEGQNRNLGVYYGKVPAVGPDTDSVEIRLEGQGTDVTPDLRMRHTRMIYKVPQVTTSPVVTFNSPINWDDDSLHTLLLDNSSHNGSVKFTFSTNYNFVDGNDTNSRVVVIAAGDRGAFYASIISGKIYLKIMQNSDNISYV